MGAGTIAEALEAATDALAAAGVETPRLDAEILLAEATGLGRAALLAGPETEVTAEAGRRFGAFVRRRVRREPVAYVVGRKGFRRLELRVDGRVLIPRPETELLVEVALELGPRIVLDVGTGSGAVALAVADELPEAEVTAVEASLGALAVAEANAARLGLARRVALVHASLTASGFAPSLPSAGFDLVLANLPYVAEAELPSLAPEITGFEPRESVVAGPTGLEAIEALLGLLSTGGVRAPAVALEVGAGQAAAVSELVRRAGFESARRVRDLAGIERVVVGTA